MELQFYSGMLPRPSHFEVCLSEVYVIFVHIMMDFSVQNFFHLLNVQLVGSMLWSKYNHMLNIPYAKFFSLLYQLFLVTDKYFEEIFQNIKRGNKVYLIL